MFLVTSNLLQFNFWAALVLSLSLTPLFIKLAHQWKFVDHPAHRKTHQEPIAYLGGVSIFVSILLTWLLLFSPALRSSQPMDTRDFLKSFFILGASLAMLGVGLWDDLKTIRARYKLTGQVLIAFLFSYFGFHFQTLHLPGLSAMPLGLLAVPLTMFWIVAIVNAFNMIDGLDGLAASVTAGTLILLACASALMGNAMECTLAVTALGAVIGFLPYNWKPAKIFLGDAGSGGLGMFAACALVALGQRYGQAPFNLNNPGMGQPFRYQVILLTLLVAYPALEITLSVGRRLLHGRPISSADRGHIHHRLLKLRWSPQCVCLTAFLITLLLGIAGLTTLAQYHGWATWILVICGILLGLGLSALGFLDFLQPKLVNHLRPHFQIIHHFFSMQRAKLRLVDGREEILSLVCQTCAELGVQGFRFNVAPNFPKAAPFRFSWERPNEIAREYLNYIKIDLLSGKFANFKDHISLEGNKAKADWTFEPHTEEDDLDVECRILVSEFMKAALDRICCIKNQGSKSNSRLVIDLLSHEKVRSNLLRRKTARRN